ncbi:auxin response factor 2 isoform X1 [Arachis hypogaea]|uniref:auxin response factor 2 isoform X1 n=1 Tax=Arachis hypogaea TaxID=3818 RepID=UPI000DED1153|nr:uncharacterized protein LOC112802928 isoform X2 [Arachis hypogaea]
MPVYDLPSKILCRVINVQLKAEPDMDEVLAQITLLPEQNQDETVEKEPPLPPRCHRPLHLDKWSLRSFPEVRIHEMYVKLEVGVHSSRASALFPHSTAMGGASSLMAPAAPIRGEHG